MQASTTRCAATGHPEFVLDCDDGIAFMLPFLLEWLEGSVTAGTVFRAGQTMQMGWSTLKVEPREDGSLTLSEPDLSGVPDQRQPGVSLTLLALYRQKGAVDSFDPALSPAFPSMNQSALCCDAFPETPALTLSRVAADAQSSGWFFGCSREDHDHRNAENLWKAPLYELACQRPAVIEFLAMPVGSLIQLDAEEKLVAVLSGDGRPLKPTPGSYLDRESKEPEAP